MLSVPTTWRHNAMNRDIEKIMTSLHRMYTNSFEDVYFAAILLSQHTLIRPSKAPANNWGLLEWVQRRQLLANT